MRKTKLPKKKKKFRLLLDAAFAKANQFPRLSKKANLSHVVYDCKLSPQSQDNEIYQKAVEENRLVLTINFKDFKKLVQKEKSGILRIESQLTNEQIDKLLTAFISGKDPKDFGGKAVKIPMEGV